MSRRTWAPGSVAVAAANRRDTADFEVAAAACSTACPAGSSPRAQRRDDRPASIFSSASRVKISGGGEQVIAGQVQLAGPAGGPHPRAGHREAAPAQGHRPVLAAVPVPGAARVVLAVRPAQPRDVLVEHGGHHLHPGAHGQGQQALLRRPRDLGHRHDHLPGNDDFAPPRVRLGAAGLVLAGVAHGGPSPSGVPSPFTRGLPSGRLQVGDRHSQVLRRSGQPRASSCALDPGNVRAQAAQAAALALDCPSGVMPASSLRE